MRSITTTCKTFVSICRRIFFDGMLTDIGYWLLCVRHSTGQLHDVWYDDPETTAVKYRAAKARGVKGLGTRSVTPLHVQQRQQQRPKRKGHPLAE